MIGILSLSLPQAVVSGSKFDCAVLVDGASPNTAVTVTLDETHGVPPLYVGGLAQIQVGNNGAGAGVIQGIALHGPVSQAILVAWAISAAGDVFTPAVAGVRVV
jgi:hypothetical protein